MSTRESAGKPDDLPRLVSKAFEAGDLEWALTFYEPGAAMVCASGEITTSPERIRREIEDLIAIKPKLTIEELTVVRHEDGNIATTRARGHIAGTGPDGSALHIPFHTLEVCRKQADGTWRYAIDDAQGSNKGG